VNRFRLVATSEWSWACNPGCGIMRASSVCGALVGPLAVIVSLASPMTFGRDRRAGRPSLIGCRFFRPSSCGPPLSSAPTLF